MNNEMECEVCKKKYAYGAVFYNNKWEYYPKSSIQQILDGIKHFTHK
jgi:hypothetical protein